jgi:chromosome segregation ATPase
LLAAEKKSHTELSLTSKALTDDLTRLTAELAEATKQEQKCREEIVSLQLELKQYRVDKEDLQSQNELLDFAVEEVKAQIWVYEKAAEAAEQKCAESVRLF